MPAKKAKKKTKAKAKAKKKTGIRGKGARVDKAKRKQKGSYKDDTLLKPSGSGIEIPSVEALTVVDTILVKQKSNGKRPGRDYYVIDLEYIKRRAQFSNTREEVAATIGISARTLDRAIQRQTQCEEFPDGLTYVQFAGYYTQWASASIRKKQIEVALQGNQFMLKWLGIQYLDQYEKREPPRAEGSEDASKALEEALSDNDNYELTPEMRRAMEDV